MDKIRAAFIYYYDPVAICIFGEGECVASIIKEDTPYTNFLKDVFIGCPEEFWSRIMTNMRGKDFRMSFQPIKDYTIEEFIKEAGELSVEIKKYVNVALPQEEL